MPKHPANEPQEKLGAYVPSSFAERIRYHLRDPFTGKVQYGALSKLIHQLLREWVQKQEETSDD